MRKGNGQRPAAPAHFPFRSRIWMKNHARRPRPPLQNCTPMMLLRRFLWLSSSAACQAHITLAFGHFTFLAAADFRDFDWHGQSAAYGAFLLAQFYARRRSRFLNNTDIYWIRDWWHTDAGAIRVIYHDVLLTTPSAILMVMRAIYASQLHIWYGDRRRNVGHRASEMEALTYWGTLHRHFVRFLPYMLKARWYASH